MRLSRLRTFVVATALDTDHQASLVRFSGESSYLAAGEEPPKPGLFDELALFVANRQDELQALAEELKQRGP